MATTTSITTTYAGEFAGKYIAAALLSGETLNKGGVEIKPNVKFKEVIKKVSTDAILKDATCDFDPTSTITLTERILQPEEFQVNLQLCKKDFRSDWEAVEMGYSTFDQLPPSFSDFLISHVAEKVAQKTEQNIWGGVNANAGEFDGFTVLLAADGDVNDAVTSETAFTAANVAGEIGKLVDAIPNSVLYQEDLHIYVPNNVYQLYLRHLGGFAAAGVGANGYDNKGNNQALSNLLYDGIKIFRAPGMPADHMVAAQKSNLFFGTGLLSDSQEVKVIDMSDVDGSQNVRVVMRATAGVQYGIGGDIALYTLA
ncbi:MAG: hypothetical protein ACR2M6_03645 [Vampirovibrionia bacterium]